MHSERCAKNRYLVPISFEAILKDTRNVACYSSKTKGATSFSYLTWGTVSHSSFQTLQSYNKSASFTYVPLLSRNAMWSRTINQAKREVPFILASSRTSVATQICFSSRGKAWKRGNAKSGKSTQRISSPRNKTRLRQADFARKHLNILMNINQPKTNTTCNNTSVWVFLLLARQQRYEFPEKVTWYLSN